MELSHLLVEQEFSLKFQGFVEFGHRVDCWHFVLCGCDQKFAVDRLEFDKVGAGELDDHSCFLQINIEGAVIDLHLGILFGRG